MKAHLVYFALCALPCSAVKSNANQTTACRIAAHFRADSQIEPHQQSPSSNTSTTKGDGVDFVTSIAGPKIEEFFKEVGKDPGELEKFKKHCFEELKPLEAFGEEVAEKVKKLMLDKCKTIDEISESSCKEVTDHIPKEDEKFCTSLHERLQRVFTCRTKKMTPEECKSAACRTSGIFLLLLISVGLAVQ
eukprot:gnl/MRDRNA2_/MRDRNA2_155707_c0_seq1.p1 gnl/MRDRNA2_/MRDRNA2_155707_c0~~gnl/MRDRNA2_/MRDRNA2_155707_c0_seq1.p1  ORF type:complete len:190 (+),score=47.90 gnl/MRDRNA2_/MRDRNA2_155707_c0_seq1:91-660(+)